MGSEIASADRERLLAEALGFLGHDVREGHTSVLALIELQRLRDWPPVAAEFGARLEQVSRRALAAVDDFLQLAAVVEAVPASDAVDWAEAWHEVWAEAGPAAEPRGIRLVAGPGPKSLPGRGDRGLLGVLLRRLTENAIERSASGSELTGTLRRADAGVVIELDLTLPSPPRREAGRSPLGPRIVAAAAVRLGATVVQAASPDGSERLTLSAPLSRG